jgi:hypothetical protein
MRDPGPPVPWDDMQRSFASRFFATLGDAFRPNQAAPGFAQGHWQHGLSFFALTFLPLAVLSGIIPFTHTLLFGPSWRVSLLHQPSSAEIAIDVARAAGLGLLVCAGMFLLLMLPYYSLSRAYGSHGHPGAPFSVMLYRGWLIPLGQLLAFLVTWSLPGVVQWALVLVEIARFLPFVVLFSSMLSTARMASGVGPIAALAVVLVPFVLFLLVGNIGMHALEPWLLGPQDVAPVVGAR